MTKNVFDLDTNPALLHALKVASQHTHTAEEVLEQRVSFVYGSVRSDNGVTRDQVRKLILEQDGFQGVRR